jgi:precorrin-2/cobalt-factor-2 C20-methyltransferase
MTRDPDVRSASREKAAAVVADRLGSGRDVAFVTIGDPMLYSTFGYLVPLVRGLLPGVSIVVIPGVSSISAAASVTCSPIAQSDEKVIIVPAAYGADELRQWLKTFDTVVLMKVNKSMDMLLDLLGEVGLERSAVFASRVGWPDEEIITDVNTLKGKRHDYFSMVIVKTGAG